MENGKFASLLAWVNSFEIDKKIDNLSQLSDGVILGQCLQLLEFHPDDGVGQSPLEFVATKLSDFYGCNLTKPGLLEVNKISAGKEKEIAKVIVLLLCAAVKHSKNENFIEAIRSLPDNVQFDLKYFIEATLGQIDNGGFVSGAFVLNFDGAPRECDTPLRSLSNNESIASPMLQSWLCSPYPSEGDTPKMSNSQLFESLEVKELKHQLKLIKKELEIQRSLAMECESEIELLSEERNNLTVNLAVKDDQIHLLEDKCEELEHLEEVEMKLRKAEEEIKNLKQQLELAKEEVDDRNELRKKVTSQDEELKVLHKEKNTLQIKLLKHQHQVQQLELEARSQQAQSARSLKRYDETMHKVGMLEKQNGDLQDTLTREKEALAGYSDQNTLLQEENCALRKELAVFQEQYTAAMCTIGSKGQQIDQLQHSLNEMEGKHASELGSKEQQLRMLEQQNALLSTKIEKVLAEGEMQVKEFDEKEAISKAEWQEKISRYETKNSSLLTQLSKAEEMVKCCQMTIGNLTREKDEERIMAAQQLNSLEVTYKRRIEQQVLNCSETVEHKEAEFQQCLLEQELQLKEVKETLRQKNEHLEHYRETINLLEQKLASSQVDHAKVEEQYHKELEQHSVELNKLKDEHKIEITELSHQLEMMCSEHKVCVQANEELTVTISEKHNEIVDLTAEYQAYQSVVQQKEVSLLHDIKESRQEKEVALQKNEELMKQHHETVTKLQQELIANHTKAEEEHQQELQRHSAELDKLNNEHKLKVMELLQKLELTTKEGEAFKNQIDQWCSLEREEFSKKISKQEMEYANLQNMFSKQEKDFLHVMKQLEKSREEKDALSLNLKESQLVAKQQVEQLNHEQEMMSAEVKRLHDEKVEMAVHYQDYQHAAQEKEVDLLHQVARLKQDKDLTIQISDENVNKLALMEDEQKKLFVQIDYLNNALRHGENEHRVEVASYKATIDRERSVNSQLEKQNSLLLEELNAAKQESFILAEKLQSSLDTKTHNTSLWQQQVKQVESDLREVNQQLSSKKLLIHQLSKDLLTSKQEHSKTLGLLELKKEELVQVETNYKAFRENKSALLEERESMIALLQSQMTNEKQQSKKELEVIRKENEELVKSVDKLYCQQTAANSRLEERQKRFSVLEQNNNERLEEMTKMLVKVTSLQNELKEIRINHRETIDCLNIETEKNNLLENETKQLKATIEAYEQENARINKLMVQHKYSIRTSEDEQAHLQHLHSEMDQSSCIIPLQPAQKNTGCEDNPSRMEELRARNSFHPPHLKSCYPVELQLHSGTPKSSELHIKSFVEKKTGYFEASPPRKRNMAHRQQQFDSPDCVKRRVSAPPTPTSHSSSAAAFRTQLRSFLNDEQDENKPPKSRPSDAFEITLNLDEKSRVKMEERKSKMFERMAATRKSQHKSVTKPLRTRNAPKK